MTSRRGFLAGLFAASATPRIGWSAIGSPDYLAAAKTTDDTYVLVGFTAAGETSFSIPLPARGHAGAAHPTRAEAVAFARRPGDFAFVIDCASGAVSQRLSPPKGHHFNGHGVYSRDGKHLFTSEQVSQGSAGRIGVWETENYTRVDTFPTGGIGPHEILLSRDGQTLVIANGGIETNAETREELNLDTMRPNLTYASLDGAILEQVTLPAAYRQNSIRHLAVGADGVIAFAMQWQGDAVDAPPLLGLHRHGKPVALAEAPLAEHIAMKGYAGSVSFDGAGQNVVISSPKGGKILAFDRQGAFLGSLSRADVCGLAQHPTGILASDGHGALMTLTGTDLRRLSHQALSWDNHIITL